MDVALKTLHPDKITQGEQVLYCTILDFTTLCLMFSSLLMRSEHLTLIYCTRGKEYSMFCGPETAEPSVVWSPQNTLFFEGDSRTFPVVDAYLESVDSRSHL